MFTKTFRVSPLALGAVALTTSATLLNAIQPASALTIAENTTGLGTSGSSIISGQSVTTGSDGPWNNITFNFFSDVPTTTTPVAFGTLFLLDREYLGTAAALSSLSLADGLLAQSQNISGGQYIFDPMVELKPNTKYFFYANGSGQVRNNAGGVDVYPGGNYYFASANLPFLSFSGADATFRLSGTPVASNVVPVPPTALSVVLAAALGTLRRRKQSVE